jgi:phospholipid/cholesterol/gamma-HCH transport system permease protein
MIADRLDRLVPSRDGLRRSFDRALTATGSAVISGVSSVLLFASLAATVAVAGLRRGVWRAPVRAEFNRALRGVAVRSLGTAVATGLLVGFALVSQAVYWLAATGQSGLVGPIIVILLVREIVPVLVGLIVFGRSGTATLIELGEAQTLGWLRLFEMQGLDPLVLLVLPRVLGFAIGAFCLATVLLISTLLSGYLVAHGLGLIAYSLWDFADMVLRATTVNDFIVPPLKCMTIGALVALACCATGLGRRDETDELQRLVPRGFVRSALAILLVNGLFDLVA